MFFLPDFHNVQSCRSKECGPAGKVVRFRVGLRPFVRPPLSGGENGSVRVPGKTTPRRRSLRRKKWSLTSRARDCGASSRHNESLGERHVRGSCGRRRNVRDHRPARPQIRSAPLVLSRDTSGKWLRDRVEHEDSSGAAFLFDRAMQNFQRRFALTGGLPASR